MQGNPNHERLLEAGVETMQRSGFNGCGVQDIIEAAGVPKGSFYNHFESKEALGAAAIERYFSQRASKLLAMLADYDHTPVDRIRHYFAAVADRMSARGYAGGCLIGNLSAELPGQSTLIANQLAAALDEWSAAFESCLREGQECGQIRADVDAASLGRFLVNALQGAILRAKVDKDDTSLADLQRATETLVA